MKLAKTSSHLGESAALVGVFLAACVAMVLLVHFSSSQL